MAFPLWLAAPLIVGAACYAGFCDAKQSFGQHTTGLAVERSIRRAIAIEDSI